ncbi:hypothetical protein [Rhodococcus sp. IEGM 1408]|uniref:hypothetical protein n=1 Tax=Rhodococcus sp. IEGM 1408 TaxID=3082220 RepID=UPI0029559274|nr:hypothetical protein [Rhodococcus sp. IEGM 1408]MDV8001825.1 hypothetical protein [Rhodococcus sp. IEGM 1408]
MSFPLKTALLSTATLTALAVAPAVAGAQNVIPGDVNAGKVVVTSLPGVIVTVTQPNLSAVTVGVANNSGRNLTCAGPEGNGSIGASVTTAPVTQAAVQYYANFAYKSDPVSAFGSSGNVQNQNGTITAQVPFGPLLGLLPSGSISPILGDAYAARDWISRGNTAAKMAGHAGTTGTFSVNNGATQSRSVPLSAPSSGPRTDFSAGAFLVCSDPNGQAYALAGYEGGVAPSPSNGGTLPIGSTGNR